MYMFAMQIFILFGCFHGLFLSIAVFFKRKKSLSNVFLALWIVTIAYIQLMTYFYLSGNIKLYILFFLSIEFSLFLSSLFSFLYIKYLIDINSRFNKLLILLFIPAVFSITFFLIFLFTNTPLAEIYFNYAFLSFIQAGIYFILILNKLIKKRKAFIDWMLTRSRKIWIYSIIILFSLTLSISLIIILLALIPGHNLFINEYLHTLIALLVSFEIYLLGYFALTHPTIFVDEIDYNKKYPGKIVLADQNTEKEFKRIKNILATEKMYKKWDLTLEDLTEAAVITSSNRLSQIIKKHKNINFTTFINNYRLEEVKALLLDPGKNHQTILELAYESGFNSKATFNRVFKESICLTPKEFRIQKQNIEND